VSALGIVESPWRFPPSKSAPAPAKLERVDGHTLGILDSVWAFLDALTMGERAFIDFLVSAAIERWQR